MMGLHANKEETGLIYDFKKKLVKPLFNRVSKKYRKIVKDRIENGWKRTTTSKIKKHLDEITKNLNDDNELVSLINIFLVIYDSDNAYADFFHEFVERCNKKELVLKHGNKYLSYKKGSKEWWENEYEEQEQMSEEELENLRKNNKYNK